MILVSVQDCQCIQQRANFTAVFCFSYREKASQDAAAVSRHVEYLLQSVGKVSHYLALLFCILLKSFQNNLYLYIVTKNLFLVSPLSAYLKWT